MVRFVLVFVSAVFPLVNAVGHTSEDVSVQAKTPQTVRVMNYPDPHVASEEEAQLKQFCQELPEEHLMEQCSGLKVEVVGHQATIRFPEEWEIHADVIDRIIQFYQFRTASDFDKLAFTSIDIIGTLALQRLDAEMRIHFDKVTFHGERALKNPSAGPETLSVSDEIRDSGDENRYSILFDDVVFTRKISFTDGRALQPILIRNTTFADGLEFSDFKLLAGLIFDNVRMDEISILRRNYFFNWLALSNVLAADDLIISDNVFYKQKDETPNASLATTSSIPSLLIQDSIVEQSLYISDNIFTHSVFAETPETADHLKYPSFYFIDSAVNRFFRFRRNTLDHLAQFYNSTAARFDVRKNRFNQFVNIFSLQAQSIDSRDNDYLQGLQVHATRVEGNLSFSDRFGNIVRTSPGRVGPAAPPVAVNVSSNRVEGDLSFAASALAEEVGEIFLRNNNVGKSMPVRLPVPVLNDQDYATRSDGSCVPEAREPIQGRPWFERLWHGPVHLTGTHVTNELSLAFGMPYGGGYVLPCSDFKFSSASDDYGHSGAKAAVSACGGRKADIVVDLTLVDARVLTWDLPFHRCAYRWTSAGNLHYDYWGSPNWLSSFERQDEEDLADGDKSEDPGRKRLNPDFTPQDLLEHAQHWMRLMVPHALMVGEAVAAEAQRDTGSQRSDPGGKRFLATYLDERGDPTASRELLYEVKNEHYSQVFSKWWEQPLYGFLKLSGFGVKPELPFVLFLGLFMVCLIIYLANYAYYAMKGAQGIKWSRLPVDDRETKYSRKAGFLQYERDRQAQDFNILIYAIDASLPVVDLHTFSKFYPANGFVRIVSLFHHLFAWILLTALLASATVL